MDYKKNIFGGFNIKCNMNNPCGLHRVHVTACGFLWSQVFKWKP